MASTQDYIDYIVDQIGLENTSYKKMFGEYAVYISGKVVGFVCDNTLFIKILPENGSMGTDLERGPAYPGSKDYFIVDEQHLEDRGWLREFIQLTADSVPEKKKKSQKKGKQ